MSSDYMTVQEAASKLSCSEETIRRMIRNGTMPARKIGLGRDYRIPNNALALSQGSGKIKK